MFSHRTQERAQEIAQGVAQRLKTPQKFYRGINKKYLKLRTDAQLLHRSRMLRNLLSEQLRTALSAESQITMDLLPVSRALSTFPERTCGRISE